MCEGSWESTQYTGEAVDPTGLTFTANYADGTTETVTHDKLEVEPEKWANEVGEQEAEFKYTRKAVTKSAKKKANVVNRPVEDPEA